MIFDILTSNTLAFVLCGLVLGLLVGSFLNVVIHRLPIMMQRDWRAQAREFLELPAEPASTFNLMLQIGRAHV